MLCMCLYLCLLALQFLNCQLQIAVGPTAHQQQAHGRNGHSRTSTASARWSWALSGLKCKLQISEWAVLDQQAPDRSRHYRIACNSKRQIAVGTTGPQQQAPDRRGHASRECHWGCRSDLFTPRLCPTRHWRIC